MPPSVAPESLDRHISSESFQSFSSVPYSAADGAGSSKTTMSYRLRDRYPGCGNASDVEDEDSVALWERPSWSQSLRRLRWCCPGAAFTVPKGGMEHTSRARTQSESSMSSRSGPSPTPSAPQYQWEVSQQQEQLPSAHGWYPPHQSGYPYRPAAWGYPHPAQQEQLNCPTGPMAPFGMMYPSPPQLFPSKTYGYTEPKQRKDMAPVVAHTLPAETNYANHYDSATESELSCPNQAPPSTPKQRRVPKPPLVQRRVTAPVHTCPYPSLRKDASPILPHKPPLQPLGRTKSIHGSPRPRLVSEMSRNSMASTSSRHRRQMHDTFAFSTSSLHEIAAPGPTPTGPPPLSFIEVAQQGDLSRTESWSSWEHDDVVQSSSSLLLSPDSEDDDLGYISPVDEEKAAFTGIAPTTNEKPEEWMEQWATQKASLMPPLSPQRTISSRTSESPPVPTKETASGPVYLPLSFDLDNQVTEAGGTLVLSGWAAVSEGDALRNKLALSETSQLPVERDDIAYLQLVKEGGQWNLKFYWSRTDVQVLPLTRSLQAQSQEVCGRAGRCVLLQDAWTRQVLYTILPVSLPQYFFRQGKLLSARNFGLLQSAMFTPFYNATMGSPAPAEWSQEYCLRRYAPDAQHDAAMHILFCLDAALREG